MPVEITIPRLGWNMDEGLFVGWLKQDGDPVRAGEPIFSLEGEKATQDIEAVANGTLHIPQDAPRGGETVPVGKVVGYLLQPGESSPGGGVPMRPAGDQARDEGPAIVENVTPAVPEPVAPIPAIARGDGPRSSPLARRLARELGVDWTRLSGSGRTGRVRKADVLAAATGSRDESKGTSSPLTPTRKAIAARLVESRQTTAPVTLTTNVDAANLVALRQQFKAAGAAGEPVPGVTDIVVKLVALALREHPRMHSRWLGDRLETPPEANIGFAVDTEAGLLVPVIRGAASLGLRAIAARARELAARARDGRPRAGDLDGGTFTVTNLGAYGVVAFTPIINPGETAILGLGRIGRAPVMDGDRVVGRERMVLSLTFDHRVVDGAPAARFLQRVGVMVENPGAWLIE